jgi:hypothetical protein
MGLRFVFVMALCGTLNADDRVLRALERLAEEAAAFQRVAPDLFAEETLTQRSLVMPKREFHPHLGNQPARLPSWQTRTIVSIYGFAATGEASGLREFRKPLSVDGNPLPEGPQTVSRLAAEIRSATGRQQRRLLEDFEKLGLAGTVTDFGPILTLFERRRQEDYDFELAGTRLVGADRVVVLRYKQREGPAALTIWDRGRPVRQRISGELAARDTDSLPIHISLAATSGNAGDALREEADVDYAPGPHGILVPVGIVHREYRGGQLTTENRFSYGAFRALGQPESPIVPR